MEEKFIAAWAANREKAAKLGVRMRPVAEEEAMKTAHRSLWCYYQGQEKNPASPQLS